MHLLRITLLSLTVLGWSMMQAQDIVINELLPSNSAFFDDFSNSSDWIELFNPGSELVDLSGMRLADDDEYAGAWQFGNVSLAPGRHLLIFASDQDIRDALSYRTIIRQGDSWQYLLPDANPSSDWRLPAFDDSSWDSGDSGFGYGDGDDVTIIPQGTRSVYVRKVFALNALQAIAELLLHVDYDDAFIAYINGVEVARANIGALDEETPFDAVPYTDHEAGIYRGESPDLFDISDVIPFLNEGGNVLAIQAYNISTSSSDFTLIPFLTLGTKDGGEHDVPDILPVPESQLHTDFKLSADGEMVTLFSSTGEVIDQITFPALPADISYGRKTDNGADWVLFQEPTPGTSNGGPFYDGVNPSAITFSHSSGLYGTPFMLELSGSANIYYTLDSSDPDAASTWYSGPIVIDDNTIVKAAIIEPGLFGRRYVENYLIGADHSLPVMALNTEEQYLWDEDIGMYVYGDDYQPEEPFYGANFWEDWEYPFYISYYDANGDLTIGAHAGAKIFGGWSRARDQRSFSLFARAEYGTSLFEYKFFDERPYSEFEALVLRNSGNDWDRAFLRDAVMTTLLHGTEVDYQAYQPVVAYLNGAYWGMYNLREKINEHYIASLHNVDSDDVDLIENNGQAKHGNNVEYLALRSFIESNSIADDQNYAYVMSQIDETNFIQYQAAQIYYNNKDWPGNNLRCWKTPDTKWRWIIYDTDFGLNLYGATEHFENTLEFATEPNGPGWPNPPWSTLFLRRFLENAEFERKFVNYFADLMNTIFMPEVATAHVDSLAAIVQDDIGMHRERWGHDLNYWYQQLASMKEFFNERPAVAREFIMERFDLPVTRQLHTHIDDPQRGSIRLNSLTLRTADWSGVYYQNNPVTLTALPDPGFAFDRWSGDVNSTQQAIQLNLNSTTSITAHFVPSGTLEQPIVINEINYNPPDEPDAGDWVELHNYSDEVMDISSWVLKDDDDDHEFVLPENTMMTPRGFLVLCRHADDFAAVYPEVQNFIGDVDFGLSSSGDAARLYNTDGELQDEVYFSPNPPWPEEPDGQGPTLELLSPELDNAIAANWKAFPGMGTPGAVNHTVSSTYHAPERAEVRAYPNPTRDVLHFAVDPGRDITSVRMYDMVGRLQASLLYPPGLPVSLDVSQVVAGPYVVIVTLSDGSVSRVMVQKLQTH